MEIYVIPFHKKFIIYRPLRSLAFVGNSAMVRYIKDKISGKKVKISHEIDRFLEIIGFWQPDLSVPPFSTEIKDYFPSMAVLLMTGDCNLRCTYCYARGGEDPSINMPFSLARIVIDEACQNAHLKGQDFFSLSFHGGGEPTLNWQVLKKSVEYAESKDISCKITMSSNGIWNKEQRNFIIEKFDNLNLSFDGIKEIQDRQRPLMSGGSSFDIVMESINAMDRADFSYAIRLTAIPGSFSALSENVKFFCEKTKCSFIQVEPCYSNIRGEYKDPSDMEISAFAGEFMRAFHVSSSFNRTFFYSGARPWLIAGVFCRGPEDALIVTPEGDIVACFEAHDRRHPLLSDFLTGHVTESGILLDMKKICKFFSRRDSRRKSCRGCFCYWHCGGDCVSRCISSAEENYGRCQVNRLITREILASYIEGGNGIWNGFFRKVAMKVKV